MEAESEMAPVDDPSGVKDDAPARGPVTWIRVTYGKVDDPTPKRYIIDPQGRTNPFVWCAAIICAIIAVAVIIAGIAVFVGYIVIHPRIPSVSVISASLNTFRYDQSGLLVTQIIIVIQAKNDNRKAHASFQNTSFILSFDGMKMAVLVADPFDVEKNKSKYFNYVVGSDPIPLSPERMEVVSDALRRDEVVFDLKGNFRARWRIGLFGSVKYWCHLSCELLFHPANGTYSKSNRCSSISK